MCMPSSVKHNNCNKYSTGEILLLPSILYSCSFLVGPKVVLILTLNITIEKSGINNITFEAYDQLKKFRDCKKKRKENAIKCKIISNCIVTNQLLSLI